MATSYTSLLGLALPVTGELQGTWGDTVNNYITAYVDAAVAGTQTISGSQTAVTLSVTNGSSLSQAGSGATGSAQYQIINCTGNPASLLTITAPASSRQYIILNATSTSQSVKIVGVGPTTGVTLASGEKAHVAWNGSDFVKVATTAAGAAAGSNTQVQYNSSGNLAGSANLTFDGTTLTAANFADSSLTSGRITYAGTSGNLTDSANLTFDGTTLTLSSNAVSYAVFSSTLANGGRAEFKDGGNLVGSIGNGANTISSASALEFCVNGNTVTKFGIGGTEKMRLSSSDFRISSGVTFTLDGGTANGVAYLNGSKVVTTGSALVYDGTILRVNGSTTSGLRLASSSGAANGFNLYNDSSTDIAYLMNYYNGSMVFGVNNSEQARLTSTGLGIGTSSPDTKFTVNANAGAAGVPVAWLHNSGNVADYDGVVISCVNDGSDAEVLHVRTNNTTYNNGTSLMLVRGDGNVGIGTSSPSRKLTVYGSDGVPFFNVNGYDVASWTSATLDFGGITASQWNTLRLFTNGSERLRLDSSGNLGLGVTPSAWGSSYRAIEGAQGGALSFFQGNAQTFITSNAYNNNTNWIYKTTAPAAYYNVQGVSGAHAWFTAPSGTAGNAITFTQAMTLDASGNLGIGVTSPTTRLSITDSTGPIVRLIRTSNRFEVSADNDFMSLNARDASTYITFKTADTERARITSGGDLGVGTASPTSRFHVSGGAANTEIATVQSTQSSTPLGQFVWFSAATPNNTTQWFIKCQDSTAERVVIRSNGGIANYSGNNVNLSDRREKKDFAPAKSYLDTICAIPVQTFNYIDQPEDDPGLTLGVVAQDVQAVAPELVMESNWGTELNPRMRLSIYQTDLQYALMKSIQELKAELDSVKAELATLKGA